MFVALVMVARPVLAGQVTVDAGTLERLENLINAQQQQIEALRQEVDQLKRTTMGAKSQGLEAKTVAETAVQREESAPVAKVVTSGQDRIKLSVSGQVHRAMNVADDGHKTNTYFVDPDSSNTRVRFVGTARLNDDLTLGSRLEIALAPNESSQVSQDDQESGNFIDERWADLSLESKRFGTIYLGKGDTSSNNTAEIDLSGTEVVQYADIGHIVGGLYFRQSGNNELTSLTVNSAFTDFDGLSRKSRLRYDTPKYHGFGLSGSVISDQRWDTSLWWGGEGYGFKTAAAAALAYINTVNADYQYDGSFSVLHQATGLNATFSAGKKDADGQSDPYNLWGKIGWQTSLTKLGKTSFAIDYDHSENISADDDKGDSYGACVVQSFADYGTEVYLQYRKFSLERDNAPNVSDINVGTMGARVKF